MAHSELDYAAMEMVIDVIRLARDRHGHVYVVTNHVERYSAPYNIALASGELYNERMEVYKLDQIEIDWLNSISPFAKDLEIIEPVE